MRQSRRHHYIPQFWIKRWCGEDGMVARFMKQPTGFVNSLRRPPKSVGYWDGLYSPPVGIPDKLQLEELFFKKLDDKYSKLFKKLENDVIHLEGEEAHTLAVFILTLMHRTPDGLLDFYKASEKQLELVREEIRPKYEQLRGSGDPLTVEEYEAQEGPEAGRRTSYRLLPRLVVNKAVVEFLAGMSWRIFEADGRARRLLLGDDPLIRTNGLKQLDGHLAFPLSPTKLVVAAYKESTLDALATDRRIDLFARVNRQSVQSARHFVIAEDERQAAFIRKHFGAELRPTLGSQILASLSSKDGRQAFRS